MLSLIVQAIFKSLPPSQSSENSQVSVNLTFPLGAVYKRCKVWKFILYHPSEQINREYCFHSGKNSSHLRYSYGILFSGSHMLARTTLVHPTPSFISQPKSLFPFHFILSISSFIPVLFSVLPVTDFFLTSSPCCFFVVYCTFICPLELRTVCSLNELPKKENHGCHMKWQLQCTISRRCPGTLWIKKNCNSYK